MIRALLLATLLPALGLAQRSTDGHHWWTVDHVGHADLEMAEWVAREEGLRLDPYYDTAGYVTIGVGHRLSDEPNVPLSQWSPITRDEALAIFDQDLQRFREGIEASIEIELNDDQLTALVSLAYNIGLGAFHLSDLVHLINSDSTEYVIVLEWTDWCKAHVNGRLHVVEGLLERRRREVALFFGED